MSPVPLLSVSHCIFLHASSLFTFTYFLSGLPLASRNHDFATFEPLHKVSFNLGFPLHPFCRVSVSISLTPEV